MKRSEINAALRELEQMAAKHGFVLPPFCNFTPEEWAEKGHEYDEIRDNMLGWDITDYGLGDFDRVGFSLITLRNGNMKMRGDNGHLPEAGLPALHRGGLRHGEGVGAVRKARI